MKKLHWEKDWRGYYRAENIKECNPEYDGPVVLDLNCHEYHTYDPKVIGWQTPIEDMYPYLPDEEFDNNMFIEKIGQDRVYPTLVKNETWDKE